MILGKSITFDGEKIGEAVVAPTDRASGGVQEEPFIERLKMGDSAAFDSLVDRYSNTIFALLFRLTGDREEASDLTQDTFLRAFRSIKKFRGDSELKTWLVRIAINESRNRFRWWKRRRRDSTLSLDAAYGDSEITIADTIADQGASPEDTALSRERELVIKTAIDGMSKPFREAIILCDIEGFSYEETADALGISVGTVKSRLSRGRETLRRQLRDI